VAMRDSDRNGVCLLGDDRVVHWRTHKGRATEYVGVRRLYAPDCRYWSRTWALDNGPSMRADLKLTYKDVNCIQCLGIKKPL
jgi:hypothetical protein